MCSRSQGGGGLQVDPTCVVKRRAALTASPERPSVFAELQDAVAEVMPTLQEQGIAVYLLSDSCAVQGASALSAEISRASDEPLSRDLRANVHIRSTALYIYTSGTTGTGNDDGDPPPSLTFGCNSTSDHQGVCGWVTGLIHDSFFCF